MSEGRKRNGNDNSDTKGNTVAKQTGVLLSELAKTMQKYGFWAKQPPSAKAMASTAPFACDSMAFEQWLQFIFIPKMQTLLAHQHPLPGNIAILPMAEEMLKGKLGAEAICIVIGKIDRLLSGRV